MVVNALDEIVRDGIDHAFELLKIVEACRVFAVREAGKHTFRLTEEVSGQIAAKYDV